MPVEGGYRFRGTWDYCSGVPYCTHFIGGALIKREGQPPVVGHAVVPRSAITIIDDWGGDKVLGMRASGSNSVRVEETFVPEHHVGYLSPGLAGTPESMVDGTAGTRLHGNPMYLGRLAGPFHITLVMPVVGAARAALDEYEEIITTRKTLSMPQILRFEHADFQRSYRLALTLTDAAEALMIRVCEMYHEYCRRWAEHGTPITTEETMRLWGMASMPAVWPARRWSFCSIPQARRRRARATSCSATSTTLRCIAAIRRRSSPFTSGLARLHFGLPWGMYGL